MYFSRSVLALKFCDQPSFLAFFPPSGTCAKTIALASWIMLAHSGTFLRPHLLVTTLLRRETRMPRDLPERSFVADPSWKNIENEWVWGRGVGILKLLNNTQGTVLWIAVMFTSAGTLFSPLDPFEYVSSPGLSFFICVMGRKLFIFEHSATGFCDGVVNLFTTVNISSRIFNRYIYLLSYLRNRMYMYVGICFYLIIDKHIECFWLVKLGPISIKDRKLHSLSPSVPSPLSVLLPPSLFLPPFLPPFLIRGLPLYETPPIRAQSPRYCPHDSWDSIFMGVFA